MKLSIATAPDVARVFAVLCTETTPQGDTHVSSTPDMVGSLDDERAAMLAAILDWSPAWGPDAFERRHESTLLSWTYQDSVWSDKAPVNSRESF